MRMWPSSHGASAICGMFTDGELESESGRAKTWSDT